MRAAAYMFVALAVVLLGFAALPLAGAGLGAQAASNSPGEGLVPIARVVDQVKAGQVAKITVDAQTNDLVVQYRDGTQGISVKEPGSLTDYLRARGVATDNMPTITVQTPPTFNIFSFLAPIVPILIFGGVILLLVYLFSRRRPSSEQSDQTGQAMQFARSRARVIVADRPSTTFADVAGADEAKEELTEVVDFLKRPDKYTALGARIPKGLLMVGPPGTGKTLLARAVAGEAGVPFLSISGSEFVEMFVGVGAARVRDLFEQARKNSPCIVFIDEVDAVGRHRGAGIGGGNDEREQTLNQILVEMDGFDARTNIIVVAATNRPDVLDQALLRPGRFDRQVLLDRPDRVGRLAIIRVHSRGKPIDPNVDMEALARTTAGFSGADLENLLNEAALLAARRDSTTVGHLDLQEAVDRVIAGPRRKSRIMSQREKAITAYHESGHAIVAHVLPNVDPVTKITIVSRGMMGGYTRVEPTEDRHLFTRSEFKDTLAWALGGWAAEQLVFGEMSTGASNDLERATGIARRMVTEYGMSERLGPVALSRQDGIPFMNRDTGEIRNYSNEIAFQIDQEVRALMDEASANARGILQDNRAALVAMAEVLIEQETLEGEQMQALLEGRAPRPPEEVAKKPRRSGDSQGPTLPPDGKHHDYGQPMPEAAVSVLGAEDADSLR
ncbi:MAG: ATP-dependent zinc metalloprotease FtsH [Chloroflexi bacterium]|nr:ATP-dependent zinc metalloprotease FtsH [Chloroflexota bacterium]MCL5107715.1 ATP-dependent zinc metalloprotease FtsH [Chloroflexota bacterium]